MRTYYFHIMHGLRGCYMPDGDPFVVAVKTRRELKDAIASEAETLRTEITLGLSKRAIAAFAAMCWRTRRGGDALPYCLPCKERTQASYTYGIFVSNATADAWRDQEQCEMEN